MPPSSNVIRLMLAAMPLGLALLAGCGHGGKVSAELEASELFELLEEQQMRYDSQAYVEVDLGTFRVTHALEEGQGQLHVHFHLFGVVPEQRKSKLEHVLPLYENRLRDAVIHLVQETEAEQLADPGLTFFRSEVVAAVNRVLQDRLLKDVAFSEFSVERD